LLVCPLFHEQRKRIWGKEGRRIMDVKFLLTNEKYAIRVARFMKATGLLGQFRSCNTAE
jgi:hypothetical protein